MGLPRRLLLAAALIFWTADAHAQVLALQLHDGRVTLHAKEVPITLILQEWAKAAEATIVNVDRIPGGLVSLDLVDVDERTALDIVLRNAVGYILVERQTPNSASTFDRILVMAATAPAPGGQPSQTLSGRPSAVALAPPPSPVALPAIVVAGRQPEQTETSGTEARAEPMDDVIDPPGIITPRSAHLANRMVGATLGGSAPRPTPVPTVAVPANMFGVASGATTAGTMSAAPSSPSPSASPSETLEESK